LGSFGNSRTCATTSSSSCSSIGGRGPGVLIRSSSGRGPGVLIRSSSSNIGSGVGHGFRMSSTSSSGRIRRSGSSWRGK
jgi:hypothetical protein